MACRLLVWIVMAVSAATLLACGDSEGDDGGRDGAAKQSPDREQFERSIDNTGDQFGLTDAEEACAKRRLRSTVSDADIVALPLDEDGLRVPSPAIRLAVARAVGVCEEGPGPKITSIDRFNFEGGLRNGLRKRFASKDLPERKLDCIMRRLRSIIDDRQIAAVGQSTSTPEQSALGIQRQVTQAVRACP